MKKAKSVELSLVGNNGGDYIKLSVSDEQAKKACLDIEVGHCCVVTLRAQVPVEFLTSLITQFMTTDSDGMSRRTSDRLKDFARDVLVYQNKDFVDDRLSQIKEYNFWGDEK